MRIWRGRLFIVVMPCHTVSTRFCNRTKPTSVYCFYRSPVWIKGISQFSSKALRRLEATPLWVNTISCQGWNPCRWVLWEEQVFRQELDWHRLEEGIPFLSGSLSLSLNASEDTSLCLWDVGSKTVLITEVLQPDPARLCTSFQECTSLRASCLSVKSHFALRTPGI